MVKPRIREKQTNTIEAMGTKYVEDIVKISGNKKSMILRKIILCLFLSLL